MGLFSRDEKVYVSSVVYQLGEELDKIPDGKDKDALRLWCMKESNFWELMKA